MTDQEKKQQLDDAINFFEGFINKILPVAHSIEGLDEYQPMDLMRNYNTIRQELSKLYVDLD